MGLTQVPGLTKDAAALLRGSHNKHWVAKVTGEKPGPNGLQRVCDWEWFAGLEDVLQAQAAAPTCRFVPYRVLADGSIRLAT